jgi:hypothetical protein
MQVNIRINDDGSMDILDPDGTPYPEATVQAMKRQNGDAIRGVLQRECDRINAAVEVFDNLHLSTPTPDKPPAYKTLELEEPEPARPEPKKPGLLGLVLKSHKLKVEAANRETEQRYQQDLSRWRQLKEEFERNELKRKHRIEKELYSDVEVMEWFLDKRLSGLEWPRETIVSTEILDDGATVFVDVDLPEIEDLPSTTANLPGRAFKLTIKQLSETNLRKLYLRHIHGIGFRIIGEVFSALPAAQRVLLSGYSQRPDASTGHVVDEYLFSVNVGRSEWASLNLKTLEEVDPVLALENFDLRRQMTKTGIFKAIDPYSPDEIAA